MNSILTKELTGAQILLESIKNEGVDTIFGYPGGIIVGIYDAIYKDKEIKHILVRHEQAAIHAAEGYARTTDKCGVAIVTSGPGATNTITGLANAYIDGYPLVVFTGQVLSNMLGTDAFQEADMVGITRSCTKHNFLVKDVKNLAKTIKEAFYIANTGKKGPVLVDLAKNILGEKTEFNYPEKIEIQGYLPKKTPQKESIIKAVNLLSQAKKPVIISGGGVILSNASTEVNKLSNLLNIPVSTSLMGVGSYNKNDDKNLGMVGMHGTFVANHAVCNCDVLLAIGARFNDRSAGSLKDFAKNAKVIHIDIDECSISKIINTDIPLVGDAKEILKIMIDELNQKHFTHCDNSTWIDELKIWKEKNKLEMPLINSKKLHAPQVLKQIANFTKSFNPIVSTEVGQHQMWTIPAFEFEKPRQLITSGGLGTMGFGLPAAIGASIANPDNLILNIAGDGSLQMNSYELATCVQYNLPIKIMVINNGYLGMVRQWQEKLFEERYSQTQISNPDFVKLAQAYGALGLRVNCQEEILPNLQKAIQYNGPALIDFVVEPLDTVYPWVLDGVQTPRSN